MSKEMIALYEYLKELEDGCLDFEQYQDHIKELLNDLTYDEKRFIMLVISPTIMDII